MALDLDTCAQILQGAGDTEQLTLVLVSGADRAAVMGAFAADPAAFPSDAELPVEVGTALYAFGEVDGGCVAMEYTGYADPSPATLRALSGGAGRVAVCRSNIQAHDRFGCAADGVVVFDDDEYMYVDDPGAAPPELTDLFRAAWVDLDDEEDEPEEGAGGFVSAFAMALTWTGLTITAADLHRVGESSWHLVTGQGVYGPT